MFVHLFTIKAFLYVPVWDTVANAPEEHVYIQVILIHNKKLNSHDNITCDVVLQFIGSFSLGYLMNLQFIRLQGPPCPTMLP